MHDMEADKGDMSLEKLIAAIGLGKRNVQPVLENLEDASCTEVEDLLDLTEEDMKSLALTAKGSKKVRRALITLGNMHLHPPRQSIIGGGAGAAPAGAGRVASSGSSGGGGMATEQKLLHISYSREDSETLVKVQNAAQRAHWRLTGVMSNQGSDWFSAWETMLLNSAGVCIIFTEGDKKVLNNQGVGYKEKLAGRFEKERDEAALYREAITIFSIKAQRPNFKIYVVDGVQFTTEQLAFNLMDDAPSFGPVDEWRAFIEGGCKWARRVVYFSKKWADRVRQWEIPNGEIRFGEVLGSGGQGQVKEAWCYGMHCAAKVLVTTTNRQHEEASKTLQKELQALSQLHHPNIIRLLHVCVERGHLCVLTELAERGNLEQVLEGNPTMGLTRIFSLLHGVVLGMKVLHAHKPRPILHNDLKPANVLVGKDWIAKLGDFGSSSGANTTAATTRAGGAAGTLKYQAPEVLGGEGEGSAPSDVYSFAITMYETMTRAKAWPGRRLNRSTSP
jgi:hypothetical protein